MKESVQHTSIVDERGYVTSPIEYNQPLFTIAPIHAELLVKNSLLFRSDSDFDLEQEITKIFPDQELTLTLNGRAALRAILSKLELSKEDSVCIVTTTGNHYISSCVTSVIEEFCTWNREVPQANTRAILVNHEFGYPLSKERLEELSALDLPLIEDCAYSLGCRYEDGEYVGSYGDYSFFSFSKIFGIQIGGFALSDGKLDSAITIEESSYIRKVVGPQLTELSSIVKKRRENHHALSELLSPLGIHAQLTMTEGAVPGVFLFRSEKSLDLPKLKSYLWSMGVQSSVFYGMEAFYIPCHQFSTEGYMDMIFSLLKSFIDEG